MHAKHAVCDAGGMRSVTRRVSLVCMQISSRDLQPYTITLFARYENDIHTGRIFRLLYFAWLASIRRSYHA